MWHCHYCRTALSAEVQRKHESCPHCGSDFHSCKNCSFYDESLSSKCREPNSPWVADRSQQNTCEFFEFKSVTTKTPSSQDTPEVSSEAEKAKEAFRALFRST